MINVVKLYKEIKSIDSELRELAENLQIVRNFKEDSLEICKIPGFSGKLGAKIDGVFQNQVEKMEEKKIELAEVMRKFVLLMGNEPKSATFSEDLEIIIDFLRNLRTYLDGIDYINMKARFPELSLTSEKSINRINIDLTLE